MTFSRFQIWFGWLFQIHNIDDVMGILVHDPSFLCPLYIWHDATLDVWLNNNLGSSIRLASLPATRHSHDDVIKWKNFPRHWPFLRGMHRSPVDSPHKGQWRGALMFSLICAWTNGWANNGDASDLRRHRAHYDDTVNIPCDGIACHYSDVIMSSMASPISDVSVVWRRS